MEKSARHIALATAFALIFNALPPHERARIRGRLGFPPPQQLDKGLGRDSNRKR